MYQKYSAFLLHDDDSKASILLYALSKRNLSLSIGCAGQLVFVPSYFDYVRLRALLKTEGIEFAALSEYAKVWVPCESAGLGRAV